MSFSNDEGGVKNYETVSETNTMSNDDLIEAYMYGWLVVQFHIAGYTPNLLQKISTVWVWDIDLFMINYLLI